MAFAGKGPGVTDQVAMLQLDELVGAFGATGITAGDTVLVHSSLRALGPVEGGADGVIDALLAAIGPSGTLAMPTLTWGIVNLQQPVFHQTQSPSLVGALTNVLRQRPGAERSLHPTHSVAALGARSRELVADHVNDDTPCSRRSPYGKLVEWGGKVLFIGVDTGYCTLFHGAEEWAACPWLFRPEQEQYSSITADGQVIPMLVWRHTSGVPRRFAAFEEPLREIGALTRGAIGNCPLRLLDARMATEWLLAQLQDDPYFTVDIPRLSDPLPQYFSLP